MQATFSRCLSSVILLIVVDSTASTGSRCVSSLSDADRNDSLRLSLQSTTVPASDRDLTTSAAAGTEESSAAPATRGSNILYFNDFTVWPRPSGASSDVSVDDGSSSRYYSNGGSRSDITRRLLRKLQQKKRTDQTGHSASVRDSRKPDDRSVDELLAFINDMKTESRSAAEAVSTSKERTGVRKKKKQQQLVLEGAGASIDGSDAASTRAGDDRSVSSGSETLDIMPTVAVDSSVRHRRGSSPETDRGASSSAMADSSPDENGSAQDRDQFVVVQKKKKTKQMASSSSSGPNKHNSADDGRRKFKSYAPSLTSRSAYVRPVDGSVVHRSVDLDSTSWTSDAESTSSRAREPAASANGSVELCGTDFPDLRIDQAFAAAGARRNSTGNVVDNARKTDKLPTAHSFVTSYAIVAAAGLASPTNAEQDGRKTVEALESSCSEGGHSTSNMVSKESSLEKTSPTAELPSSSASSVCGSSSPQDAPASGRPAMPIRPIGATVETGELPVADASEVDRVPGGEIIGANAERGDVPSVANDGASRPPAAADKLINGYEPSHDAVQPRFGPTIIELPMVPARPMSVADRKSKCPVVFMDANSEAIRTPSTTASIGISFGFDDSVVSPAPVPLDRRPSHVGVVAADCVVPPCARCAELAAEKASASVSTNTDSATSPTRSNESTCAPCKTNVAGRLVTSHPVAGYSRLIIPLSASALHTSVHPPIGIVPPIPQVDRSPAAVSVDYADPKIVSTAERILSSAECYVGDNRKCAVLCDRQFIDEPSSTTPLIKSSLPLAQNQPAVCTVAVSDSASCTQRSASFCLLNAQIFLYKGKLTRVSPFYKRGLLKCISRRWKTPDSVSVLCLFDP